MMALLSSADSPLLKAGFEPRFRAIGLIALVDQVTASWLQPWASLHSNSTMSARGNGFLSLVLSRMVMSSMCGSRTWQDAEDIYSMNAIP